MVSHYVSEYLHSREIQFDDGSFSFFNSCVDVVKGKQATAATNLSGYLRTSSAISSLAILANSIASPGDTSISSGDTAYS